MSAANALEVDLDLEVEVEVEVENKFAIKNPKLIFKLPARLLATKQLQIPLISQLFLLSQTPQVTIKLVCCN